MRYEVTHGKDVHHVEVKEVGGNVFDVCVDEGPPVRVDACKTPRTVYSVLIGAKHFEASVDEREGGMLDVHVGSSAFDFHVIDERRKVLIGGTGSVLYGRQEIKAQMPGKIVKVLVQPGEIVEEDQGLLVIEAMKMENELRSPIAGEAHGTPHGASVISTSPILMVTNSASPSSGKAANEILANERRRHCGSRAGDTPFWLARTLHVAVLRFGKVLVRVDFVAYHARQKPLSTPHCLLSFFTTIPAVRLSCSSKPILM